VVVFVFVFVFGRVLRVVDGLVVDCGFLWNISWCS
jgi:hypothetical protein